MKVTCPNCGKVKQLSAGKVPQKVRCPECDTSFAPSKRTQKNDADTTAWYQNTPVVISLTFAFVIVGFLVGYLIYDASQSQFRTQIEALQAEGNKLQEAGQFTNAIERYEAAISQAGNSSDQAVQRIVADVKIQKENAASKLKVVTEQVEAKRKQEQEEAQAREIARIEAEQKAQRQRAQEDEQKRQQEIERQKKATDRLLAEARLLQAPSKPQEIEDFAKQFAR